MNNFFKALAGGFVGKLLAAAFIAGCVVFGVGPDKWIEFLFQGSGLFTPATARGLFFALAAIISLLLLLSIIRSPSDSNTLSAEQLAYGLAITGLHMFADKLGKRKRNIQIGVGLRNASQHVLFYDMDNMFVSVDGHTITDPKFQSTGLVLRPGETDVFRYDTFMGLDLPAQSQLVASLNISYGQPGHAALRHIRREYSGILRVTTTGENLTTVISGEDFDQPI